MGLFDYVTCLYPLPDGFDGSREAWQTKSIDCPYMKKYTVTADGRLIHHSVRYEETPREERPYPDAPEGSMLSFAGCMKAVPTGDVETDFSGLLEFYSADRTYRALFWKGRLREIEGGLDEPLQRAGEPKESEQ